MSKAMGSRMQAQNETPLPLGSLTRLKRVRSMFENLMSFSDELPIAGRNIFVLPELIDSLRP